MPSLSTCIYTIVQSEKLDDALGKGGQGSFTEKKKWVTGKNMLRQAEREGVDLLVLFAPAEGTRDLIYFAKLDSIEFDEKGTTYAFSRLSEDNKRKTSLKVASTGKSLDANFIRPYAICKTPSSLL